MGPGAADLGLGAVDAQRDPFGCGIGEDIGQRMQPKPRPVGDGETPRGQQRTDLADRPGDGGPLQAVELREGDVRELGTQVDQGDQYPVGEDEVVLRSRTGSLSAVAAASLVQCGLTARGPRPGQLVDQTAEMCTGDAGEGRMGQGRTGPILRHHT